MELNLDESLLQVLEKAFEWTDIDGDNLISRADLKLASGLQQDDQVQTLFQALASNHSSEYITFDQFKTKVLDFPFLLEQFKTDMLGNTLDPLQEQKAVQQLPVLKGSNSQEPIFLTVSDSIKTAIKGSLELMGIVSSSSFPDSLVDLTTELFRVLDMAVGRARQQGVSTEKFVGFTGIKKKLVKVLTENLFKQNQQIEDLKMQVGNLIIQSSSQNQYCQLLEQRNQKLIQQLELCQLNSKVYESEAFTYSNQRNYLKQELNRAEIKQQEASLQVDQISRNIQEKEKIIEKMNREIRNLKSLQTIHQLKSVTKNADIQKVKIQRYNTRFTVQNPPSLVSQTSKMSQEADFLDFQIRMYKQKLQQKQSKIQEVLLLKKSLEQTVKKLEKELQQRTHEVKLLLVRLSEERQFRTIGSLQRSVDSQPPKNNLQKQFKEIQELAFEFQSRKPSISSIHQKISVNSSMKDKQSPYCRCF